jgi:hypothetical protein
VHVELAGLQRRAQERTPGLRCRRRRQTRQRRLRRSLQLLLVVGMSLAIAVLALDVADLRSSAVDWYQVQIGDPAQGR